MSIFVDSELANRGSRLVNICNERTYIATNRNNRVIFFLTIPEKGVNLRVCNSKNFRLRSISGRYIRERRLLNLIAGWLWRLTGVWRKALLFNEIVLPYRPTRQEVRSVILPWRFGSRQRLYSQNFDGRQTVLNYVFGAKVGNTEV